MKLRVLDRCDVISHRVLDPVVQFKAFGRWHVPGWGWIQVAQHRLCVACENERDRAA